MLKHITTALGGPDKGHGRVPVRRQSRLAGGCEAIFWSRTDRRDVRRVLLAARKYELARRQPGRRNGPLGHVGLEVLELLVNLIDYRSGRLEPSIDYIMRKVRRSRDAVVRALTALRAHGFVDWLRRYERVEREGAGPRVRQVSNAYRISIPPRAARLISGDVPLPDDFVQDLEDRRRDLEAVKAGLSLEELALVEVDDGPLGRALAQLGRRVSECESARQTESQAKSFI
jgi:hypothetical protein